MRGPKVNIGDIWSIPSYDAPSAVKTRYYYLVMEPINVEAGYYVVFNYKSGKNCIHQIGKLWSYEA